MWRKAKHTILCDQTAFPIHKGDLYLHDEDTGENFHCNSLRAKELDPNGNIRTPNSYIDNFLITNKINEEDYRL